MLLLRGGCAIVKETVTVDCGLWTVDCGLWTVDYGLLTRYNTTSDFGSISGLRGNLKRDKRIASEF